MGGVISIQVLHEHNAIYEYITINHQTLNYSTISRPPLSREDKDW